MLENRRSVLICVAMAVACGGKTETGSDPSTDVAQGGAGGTSGSVIMRGVTGGAPTPKPEPDPIDVGGGDVGGGTVIGTPCGPFICSGGGICCDPTCGECAGPDGRCPAYVCGRPFDAGSTGAGGNEDTSDFASLKSDFGFAW